MNNKDLDKLYNKVREGVFPQLEDDLVMMLRKYNILELECALELIDALNSGVKVHLIDRTRFDNLAFDKQESIAFDVLNLARQNGGAFLRAFHPMYMLFYQQENLTEWTNFEKKNIDERIANVEERNEIFESELSSECKS